MPEAVLRTRAAHLTKPARGAADPSSLAWRFDELHRVTSPFPFFAASYRAFAARVTCPVLVVSGGPQGFHVPDEDERVAAFAGPVTRVELAGAGHMMHWTKPKELAAALVDFFRRPATP